MLSNQQQEEDLTTRRPNDNPKRKIQAGTRFSMENQSNIPLMSMDKKRLREEDSAVSGLQSCIDTNTLIKMNAHLSRKMEEYRNKAEELEKNRDIEKNISNENANETPTENRISELENMVSAQENQIEILRRRLAEENNDRNEAHNNNNNKILSSEDLGVRQIDELTSTICHTSVSDKIDEEWRGRFIRLDDHLSQKIYELQKKTEEVHGNISNVYLTALKDYALCQSVYHQEIEINREIEINNEINRKEINSTVKKGTPSIPSINEKIKIKKSKNNDKDKEIKKELRTLYTQIYVESLSRNQKRESEFLKDLNLNDPLSILSSKNWTVRNAIDETKSLSISVKKHFDLNEKRVSDFLLEQDTKLNLLSLKFGSHNNNLICSDVIGTELNELISFDKERIDFTCDRKLNESHSQPSTSCSTVYMNDTGHIETTCNSNNSNNSNNYDIKNEKDVEINTLVLQIKTMYQLLKREFNTRKLKEYLISLEKERTDVLQNQIELLKSDLNSCLSKSLNHLQTLYDMEHHANKAIREYQRAVENTAEITAKERELKILLNTKEEEILRLKEEFIYLSTIGISNILLNNKENKETEGNVNKIEICLEKDKNKLLEDKSGKSILTEGIDSQDSLIGSSSFLFSFNKSNKSNQCPKNISPVSKLIEDIVSINENLSKKIRWYEEEKEKDKEKDFSKDQKIEEKMLQNRDVDIIVLEEQVRVYKEKLQCMICRSAEKEVALIKCMHCFCSPCVNKTMESRNRSCPLCKTKFSSIDVKPIRLMENT